MKISPAPRAWLGLLAVSLLTILSFSVSAQDKDKELWRPVTPDEVALKDSKVEPGADAEAIFWEVRLDDKSDSKMTYSHYVRVKIFTERGRERFSKMDIPFTKGRKIENVAARVTKADGSVVDLKPEDIFEREIAKGDRGKIQAKSFAVPGIEPGVIVEYQYKEVIKDDSAGGERLLFQRDIPIEKVSYFVRPREGYSLAFMAYNMDDLRFIDEKKGFRVGTVYDVPALKEEPYMPPEDEVRRWVYLRYQTFGSLFQWTSLDIGWNEALKKLSKPNKEIKAKAAELTAGAQSDEDKVRRIYEFVQKGVKNVAYDKNWSEDQIDKLDVKDADDVLKKGMGRSFAIDMLFASLTRAAGFETNVVLAGDRSENYFNPQKYPYPSFVQMSAIAVLIGKDWVFFDPCTPYHPYGQLEWNRQDVKAMVIGEGGFSWKTIPISTYDQSKAKRTADLRLSETGEMEGTVSIEFTGHQALNRRRDGFRSSEAKREEDITDELKARLSTAEFSDLKIENFDDNTQPLRYKFKIKVPNYAQKVGKRLFVQPGFFEYGVSPVFSSATRTYDIAFPYPWSEEDSIEIHLPSGYVLDNPDAPAEVTDPRHIGDLKIQIGINSRTNVLSYRRSFYFGGGGFTLFPATSYAPLKGLFDSFQKADSHVLSVIESKKF